MTERQVFLSFKKIYFQNPSNIIFHLKKYLGGMILAFLILLFWIDILGFWFTPSSQPPPVCLIPRENLYSRGEGEQFNISYYQAE